MAFSLVGGAREASPGAIAHSHESGSAVPGLLSFLASLREPVFEFDERGECCYTNPAFDELVGAPLGLAHCAKGRAGLSWLREDEQTRWSFFVEVHRTGRSEELGIGPVRFAVKRVDGSEIPCEFSGERLLSRTGIVLGLVAVVKPLGVVAGHGASDLVDLTSELHRLSAAVQQLVRTDSNDGPAPKVSTGAPGQWTERRAIVAKPAVERVLVAVVPPVSENDLDGSVAKRVSGLSDRERDILHGLLVGKRTATMAREFFLSEHTVRNHLKHIYRKVGVHSLGELREILMPIADDLAKQGSKR